MSAAERAMYAAVLIPFVWGALWLLARVIRVGLGRIFSRAFRRRPGPGEGGGTPANRLDAPRG